MPRFIAIVGSIHEQRQHFGHFSQLFKQPTASWRIVLAAWTQREADCLSSILGNHMNFGVPSAARFSNGLGAVFLKRPCHQGVP